MIERVYPVLGADETDNITKQLLDWLNDYPDKPCEINFEHLPADEMGMCLSTSSAASVTNRYILGGYRARYQFDILYRVAPSDNTDRLDAAETLNHLAAWFLESGFTLDAPAAVRDVQLNNQASAVAITEDGETVYKITLTLIWEVV